MVNESMQQINGNLLTTNFNMNGTNEVFSFTLVDVNEMIGSSANGNMLQIYKLIGQLSFDHYPRNNY